MFIIFLMIIFCVLLSMLNSFIMYNYESDEDWRMPRAPIEIFMKLILRYCCFKSSKRGLYLVVLRLLLISMFVSNPTVNSKT